MKLASLFLVATCLAGCSTTQNFSIDAKPAGATIRVDGIERGSAPRQEAITFSSGNDAHIISAIRPGYVEKTISVTRDSELSVYFDLKPQPRTVKVNVEPFPAYVSVNGVRMTPNPVRNWSRELEFTIDDKNAWSSYRISVERLGFQKQEKTISGADRELAATFVLQPMRKNINISCAPEGAHVYLDDKEIGTSPLTEKDLPFATDPQTNQWGAYKLKFVKPGYQTVEQPVSWDDGQSDYKATLKAIAKTVRIVPDPAGASVTIDDKPYAADTTGVTTATLSFAPLENGEARVYTVMVSRKTASSEWLPETFKIGWDEAKTDYPITLKEVKTTLLDLLIAEPQRTADAWQIVPKVIKTVAHKDVNEGAGKSQPVKVVNLPKDTMIDSLSVSRDGSLVFTVLQVVDKNELRSWLKTINIDGTPGIRDLSDGKSLDLHPSFTADGKEIVFSSNRGGRHQTIWRIPANGDVGITKLTTAEETNDLWPVLDPAGKLYFQGLVDNRSDPRIYMSEVGRVGRTDLTQGGGTQPRLSPADISTLLICEMNDKTAKRDIFSYQLKEKAVSTNLTDAPDSDEFDAAWSPNGKRIAFVSDRGRDEDKRNNYDIWIIDVANPKQPVQITVNGSWDDRPVWSPKGDAIFFRSNRGGEWGIWKIALPPELRGGNP